MAAFLYSLNYPSNGRHFYIHFNNFTRNFADFKGYPYCNFYTALFNLKRTSQLNFSEDPRVKYIEGDSRPEMKLYNIVLYRGSRTDYLKKKVGATFRFKQFTSFSSDLETASVFAFDGLPNEASPTIFMIQENNVPTRYIQDKYVPARSIQEYSIHHESEYLIDPISQFQIVGVFQNVRLKKKNFEKNFTTVYVIKYVNNPCNQTINGVISEREG
jgi:NAD:arginine ADP-ribosyltransferase